MVHGEHGDSRDDLLAELEQLTHRRFRTRDDVREFVAGLEEHKAARHARQRERWTTVKHSTLLVLLVLAAVQFYLVDTLLQVVSIRELTVFVPVTARDVHSALAATIRPG